MGPATHNIAYFLHSEVYLHIRPTQYSSGHYQEHSTVQHHASVTTIDWRHALQKPCSHTCTHYSDVHILILSIAGSFKGITCKGLWLILWELTIELSSEYWASMQTYTIQIKGPTSRVTLQQWKQAYLYQPNLYELGYILKVYNQHKPAYTGVPCPCMIYFTMMAE